MNTRITALEKLLDGPRDGALLRFSLGNEYLNADQPKEAAVHFREALRRDPRYSAAWKALGKALVAQGELGEAATTYREGIAVAESHGDLQAVKEMQVFLRRLEKQSPGSVA